MSLKHELPKYLYDDNDLNDVNYWFNFQIINDFTTESVIRNIQHDLRDENEAFVWTPDKKIGAEHVLAQYERPEVSDRLVNKDLYVNTASKNMELLTPYFKAMPDMKFIFFCSPFSMLYWDGQVRKHNTEVLKQGYDTSISKLIEYENVSVFLWNDKEMLDIMSDLDNYADTTHYSEDISSLMLQRIAAQQGLLTKENDTSEIDVLFDYISNFNYDTLFV